jgi:phospholipid/cholesterol/gamma-HCH transport system substrate-binding protein
MRRLVSIAILVAVVAAALVLAAADGPGERYLVRAVFDNASTLVTGEDVKIAGAPVGVVTDMDVTADRKAAVTLRIDDEAFTPFKQDASCTIRLQGFIGERFVECEPGSTGARPLPPVEDGDGERLLSVEHTSSPVDLDLVGDIMRLPYRERFAILLAELGTGLAGRGEELNEVIHRANPALRETDELLAILARQNRTLARLAESSDRALGPLSRERERVASWVVQANRTAEASAERRTDIARGIDRLPPFLRELRLLMADLEGLTDQGTPLLDDLGAAAPDLGRLIRAQGTLADAGRESFPSLGAALERGRPALIRARPLIRDLGRLGEELAPASVDLDELTSSLDETGAVERINDFLYYVALSTNGFDALGHYLRAGLVTNTCTEYALVSTGAACTANFTSGFGTAAAARNAPPPRSRGGGSVPATGALLEGLLGRTDPALERRREAGLERLRRQAAGGSPALGAKEPMLDYLLGGGAR